MVHRLLLVGALLAAVLISAPAASAAPITLKKAMWGPIERDGVSQMPIYADLGVGIYQLTIRWDEVAPTRPADPRNPLDPAYVWPPVVEHAISQAAAHGIRVSILIMGAPGWSNGGREWRWAPKRPQDFADFAAAASRRWPAVGHWMVWSEPTKAQNWQPLHADRGRELRGKRLRGPRLYARMLDATYASLKSVDRGDLVIGGNTFTVGTVAPLRFIRALKLPSGRPPRMDLYGHNAFSLRSPNLKDKPLGNGYADFNDLDTLTRVLDKAMKRARPRKMRRLKIFISEYSLPTDHPNHEFNFHVTRATQASWLRKALRIVRSFDRIYSFGYLGLYDDDERPANDQVERGLLTRTGERKPGYAAFRDG